MAEKPSPETACLDAIRHWSSLPRLAEFARERVGYGDDDGGFGLEYRDNLDEYDRQVLGRFVPPGYVRIHGFLGPPEGYEMFVPEVVYLTVLARVLAEGGFANEAKQVRALAQPQLSSEERGG